jgi:hypothetical protein
MKKCKTCLKNRRLSSFYISYQGVSGAVYSVECKECSCKRTVAYGKQNKEKRKSATIKHKYGITLEDYNTMLKKQDYKCGICKDPLNTKKRFNIDHNHNSGYVRGLLCSFCNWGLGHFKESIENLNNAVKYLEESSG